MIVDNKVKRARFRSITHKDVVLFPVSLCIIPLQPPVLLHGISSCQRRPNEVDDVARLFVTNNFLEPPNDIRMTRSRFQSSAPRSPAGKRKADNGGIGQAPKRRK
jgi:hypothetical protein